MVEGNAAGGWELGPIKDKPILLSDGTIVAPSSTEDHGWRLHMEFSGDLGKSWTIGEPLNDGGKIGLIQPTLLDHGDGGLQLLCRSRNGRIYQSWSSGSGEELGGAGCDGSGESE